MIHSMYYPYAIAHSQPFFFHFPCFGIQLKQQQNNHLTAIEVETELLLLARHQALFIDESYRGGVASSIKHDDGCRKQIEEAIIRENVPGFVELINNLPSHQLKRELDWIRDLLIFHDSPKCSAAVLDGQTKITEIPRFTAWMSKVDNRPLHYAVRNTASKITALLLQRGFSADVRRDYDDGDKGLKNALPLHVVLSQLRFNRRKELSAVELILNLCNIHYYRRRLETLRLIAQNTTEVKREFFNYLKEGKAIEVGALLLVAKSQILSSSTTAKREGEFRSISEMHDFLLNNNKLAETDETTLVLLEIFNKIGDNLAKLLRLDISETCLANCAPQLAASLIKDAGYDVKPTYFYHNHSYTSFCRRAIDECEKTIRTTDMLPSWVKEAALTGLRDKSGSTSHLTYPFLAEILPNMKVSVSQLTPGFASPMPENMTLLHHLLKKTAPFLGTIKRVFRRG